MNGKTFTSTPATTLRHLTFRPPYDTRRRDTRASKSHLSVSAHTHPLDPIRDSRLLTLVDVQNVDCAARELGFIFSYRLFGKLLDATAQKSRRHVFYAVHSGDNRRGEYFVQRGWTPHVYEAHEVRKYRRVERRTNVDNLLIFFAGVLVRNSAADTVAVCSGDGQLVSDLARGIAQLPKGRRLVTFSLPGSTANELNAEYNGFIHANIELGADVMHVRRR